MTRKQLWFAYAIVCFLTIWGWDLVNTFKFRGAVSLHDIINPFHVSQLIYILSTLWLTRMVFRKFYVTKRYALLAFSLIGVWLLFSLIRYSLEQVIYPGLFSISNYPKNVNVVYYVLDNLYYALVYITFGTLIFLFDHQLITQKNEAVLKQESIQAQLAFLRSQVSPHFLFNSLNNIYALSYKKSDKAPDAILKLSELTRYMLYEKQEQIPLEKEWNYIQNFISMQQLRYDFPLNIKVSAKGNSDAVLIAPYLLIPFVENAFKHGDMQDTENPLTIELFCNSREIIFTVKNKIGSQQKDKDGGIGLENVRKRLFLLYGANQQLLINKKNDIFETHLKINLHAN